MCSILTCILVPLFFLFLRDMISDYEIRMASAEDGKMATICLNGSKVVPMWMGSADAGVQAATGRDWQPLAVIGNHLLRMNTKHLFSPRTF